MAQVVKRVLYVDHVAALSGGERSLLDLARELDRSRYAPALACPGEGPLPDAFRREGFPVYPLEADAGLLAVSRGSLDTSAAGALQWVPGSLRLAVEVARAVRSSGAHLIVSNSLKAHVVASLAAPFTRRPLIWHMRDCLKAGRMGSALSWLARLTARRVIAISDTVVDSLERAGFPAQLVTRVHNGILLRGEGKPVLRHELPIPDDAFLVGTVGQLSRWKGIHVLLTAVRHLPRVHVAITGTCLFEGNEAEYNRTLNHTAAEPDFAGRVHFLGGREDVLDVMASLDAFVHPAIEPEPFGRVLVEAMSTGTPVIASDAGAAREVLGSAGRLVKPDDAPALAAAIQELIADPLLAESMGQQGRVRVAQMFGIQLCARRVQAVYDEVLGVSA